MMYFVIWVEMTCTVSWVLLPSKLYTRETLADLGICVSRDLASDRSLRRVSLDNSFALPHQSDEKWCVSDLVP